MAHQTDYRRGVPAILLAAFFFALMAVLTRPLAGKVPATEVALVRFLVGVVGAGALMVLRPGPPGPRRWNLLLLRGLLGGGAALTYFLSLERLGAGPATVLNYASPIFAALFASYFLGERVDGPTRLGLVVALGGAALVASSTHELVRSAIPGLGVASGLASAVLGGAAMAAVRRLRANTSSSTIFFAFSLSGAVMAAPFALPRWVPLSGEALFFALAVAATGFIAQLTYTWAMAHLPTAQGTGLMQVVPALSWVLATTFLDERPTLLGLVGTALCVGGVSLGMLRRRTEASQPPVPDAPTASEL